MILRLSDSISRGLIVLFSVLLGLWISFSGIRAAIARNGAEGDTANGLKLAVRLEQPNPVMAAESYRKAVALNPLATNAWLDLAMAYELDGKPNQARDAYLEARKSYPRSAEVSWRYGNFLLRQGQQVQAYTELRRAIEADPRRAALAFSRAYRSNPNLDDILQQLLPAKPGVYVTLFRKLQARSNLL